MFIIYNMLTTFVFIVKLLPNIKIKRERGLEIETLQLFGKKRPNNNNNNNLNLVRKNISRQAFNSP